MPQERFISEPIRPEAGSFDASGIARGEPGRPAGFVWREQAYKVLDTLSAWKTSTPEGGSGESYLRRHWWEVQTDRGVIMKIYCERQARSRNAKARWYVYTVRDA